MKYVHLVVMACVSLSGPAALADTVVTNSTPNGWGFVTRNGTGDVLSVGPSSLGDYVNGPASPPLGVGSAYLDAATSLATSDGGGASELRNVNYDGVRLADLTALSYSTYMTNNLPTGQQFPYLRLWISFDGTGNYDDALFFEPPYQTPTSGRATLPDQGPTQMNTWQTWNALTGAWWDNDGLIGSAPGGFNHVDSLDAYLAIHPDATIVNLDGGSFGPLGGVGLELGIADGATNYQGNVDNFTIGVNHVDTTFNFEAAAPVPLPSAASLGYLILGGMGIFSVIRRRHFFKIA